MRIIDTTTALYDAMNDVGDPDIQLVHGSYDLGGLTWLVPNRPMRIRGAGKGKTYLLGANSRAFTVSSPEIEISDLSINMRGNLGSAAIYADAGSHDLHVHDVEVFNGETGIGSVDCDRVTFERNYIHNMTYHALECTRGYSAQVNANRIENVKGSGVQLFTVDDAIVTKNLCIRTDLTTAANYGAVRAAENCQSIVVSHNISDGMDCGLVSIGTIGGLFSHNIVKDARHLPVLVYGGTNDVPNKVSQNCIFDGNIIRNGPTGAPAFELIREGTGSFNSNHIFSNNMAFDQFGHMLGMFRDRTGPNGDDQPMWSGYNYIDRNNNQAFGLPFWAS